MRRQPTENGSQGTRVRSRDESRGTLAKRSRLRRLALESLEARQLLATLPTPIVSGQVDLSPSPNVSGANNNNSSPLIAVDPLNPQEMVTVYTNRNSSNGVHIQAEASFSTNGGTTWNSLNLPGPLSDPTVTTNPPPLNQYAEGVGFDRNGHLYIGLLEDNTADNGGVVLMEQYNASNLAVGRQEGLVYAWNQTATNQSMQPAIIDFSMAVDDNVASFTDPATGQVQSDPNSGAVYIAWTVNTPPPPSPPNPYNPFTIAVEASTDGLTWASAAPGGALGTPVSGGHNGFQLYADPQIAVLQGKAGGSDGGLVSVIWDDYGTGSHDGSNQDDIQYASLTSSGGALTIGSRSQITSTIVRGAQTGSHFGLSTPSSPIGIGPGAVVAVDNTLGSFSQHQGRIYVAYVDKYTTTHEPSGGGANSSASNPADNTDIFLMYSDNDGGSWNAAGQVNDDAGTTDGHSGAVNPNDSTSVNDASHDTDTLNDGRPQYEPQIAVDPVTGTVAMSWLDVRDDPSLDRYSDYLTASIDGGLNFSSQAIGSAEYTAAELRNGVPQPFADQPDLVTDAITGKSFVVGPYASDEAGTNPNAETSLSFGTNQGLAIYGGVIRPVWAATVQDGLGNFNSSGNGNERLTIETAKATVAAGPRVVSGTMGVVGPTTVRYASGSTAINTATAADGTDELSGFAVTFDRPVSVASFTASQVHVFYNGTSSLTDTALGVGAPVPLDAPSPGAAEATTFYIPLLAPQSAVGTYSYAIGPGVTDLMRTTTSNGDAMDQNANGVAGQATDLFEAPTPAGGPVRLASFPNAASPFDEATGPLIIPGPHVVSTGVPGGVVDPGSLDTADTTLMVNGTVGVLDVTFDRLIDSSTFTASQVLSMFGPNGPIAGPFTVTPVPAAPGGPTQDVTTFAIGFPTQAISGTYQVVLGPGIKSQAGDLVDADENAGLDLLFNGRAVSSSPTTTYAASGLPLTIGAGQTVTSTITVNDSYTLTDLALALNVASTGGAALDPGLTATLTFTPQGGTAADSTTITLLAGLTNVGPSDGFNNTVLSDTATTPIKNGASPYLGSFNPLQAFTPLLGQVQGTYTLKIVNAGAGTGTLNGWSLVATTATTNSGLGEPVADRTTASFRIFTMAPTNSQSSNTWTAVGPASENNTNNAGDVTVVAVDPSDPSGNTVYVGGGSGGIWKTTNYLTNNPNGPTYAPLISESLYGSLDISSIAIFPRNNDPGQSVVIAGTGSLTNGYDSTDPSRGVGFLISYNGGRTWTLLDSTTNSSGGINLAGAEVPEPLSAARGATSIRDDAFVGTQVNKVLVDPHAQVNGGLIFYAAVSGVNTAGVDESGVWKSVDGGGTWTKLLAGNATDLAFDPNSGVVNALSNPTGNLDVLYAAFGTPAGTTANAVASGVYITPNRGQTWTPMSGGVGDPLIQERQFVDTAVPVSNDNLAPSGGRIVLAKPALTGNAAEDEQYQTWLYAAVLGGSGLQFAGQFAGLYVTKDNGQNWTKVAIPSAAFGVSAGNPNQAVPTNNPGDPQYAVSRQPGFSSFAVAVDPNDPMVLYLGGTTFNSDPVPSNNSNRTAMIRVDISRLSDPYSFFASTQTLGGQVLEQTTSPDAINSPTNLWIQGNVGVVDPLYNPYINVLRNPNDPFAVNSAFGVDNVAGAANDGSGAWWTPFDGLLAGTTDVNTIVAEVDPLTGKTRLIVGDQQGTFTGVDDGTGTLLTSIGGAGGGINLDGGTALPTGSRNGNLQIAQFFAGATQPSTSAAGAAGALFYGASSANGDPASGATVLSTGNLNWSSGNLIDYGTDVATDQQGSGEGFYSMYPGFDRRQGYRNFFQVGDTEPAAIGRTFGLLQTTTGGGVTGDAQNWPDAPSFNFAVNPVDDQDIVTASAAGRVFATQNQGTIWSVVAQPGNLDGSQVPALAYGAPASSTSGSVGNYIVAGTAAGNIFVTFTGGGNGSGSNNWANISAGLDGSPVERIVTDPTRGTNDAFAVTRKGVYYDANTAAAGTKWVNITGNLFKLTVNAFGDSNLTEQQLQSLNALAVDWRYVIPDAAADPNHTAAGATHPVVYVAGQGGVFRTLDDGATWTQFPAATDTTVPQGNMPVTDVTDLDMELGSVDPTTGHANVSTGSNVLLATTYGTGDFAIHLSPIVFNTTANPIKVAQASNGTLTFTGLSEQSAFGNTVTITIRDVTDPNNPIVLGAGPTGVLGNFSTQANYPTAPANNPFLYDGARKIAVFATDGSGNAGNPVILQITNNLPTPAAPAFVNPTGAPTPLTNGLVTGGVVITTSASPAFAVTLPGTNTTATVSLVRIDAQNNKTTVKSLSITGAGTIQDPGPVALGTYTYEVQYTVTIPGTPTPTTSPLSAGTTVKVVAPETIGLLAADDSGTKGDGITNVQQPHFVGTAVANTANDPALTVKLVVITAPAGSGFAPGAVLGTVPDPGNGQYNIQPSVKLPDGTYTVAVQARDAAGDAIASPALTLTISTTGPTSQPTLNLLPASELPPNNPNATVVRRPFVSGMTDPGLTVNIFGSINGGPLQFLVSTTSLAFPNGGRSPGSFQAQLPSNLGDGTIQLYAFVANAAGNADQKFASLPLRIFSVAGDYSDAGRAGLAVYTPSSGSFTFVDHHPGAADTVTFLTGFGLANVDIPVVGDYNGDGEADPAIYRPTNGWWAIDESSQAAAGQAPFVVFVPPIVAPGPNVVPAPGDFDTDGMTDPAVFSIVPVNGVGFGVYTILHSQLVPGTNSSVQSIAWGLAGDTPVPGDYDGAGAAQIAGYRPSNGAWYIRSSGVGGGAATPAGKQETPIFVTAPQAGDVPVPADYDGIGRVEPAIYRPSTETFFIYNPNTKTTRSVPMANIQQNPSQLVMPASADFTGDGKADPAIFNQATGVWEYIDSTTNKVVSGPFSLTLGDIALTAPGQYRALADAAAQPAFRTAGAFLAPAPASTASASSATPAPAGKAAAAVVVVGATTPTGLTSTGKASTLPAVPAATTKPVVLVDSGTGSARPTQGATDSAIASLGKSYNGLFV